METLITKSNEIMKAYMNEWRSIMLDPENDWFAPDCEKEDYNEQMKKKLVGIQSKIESINDEDDESLFSEDSIFADDTDCEDDLFNHQNEEYEKDQIDYSRDKLEVFSQSSGIIGSIIKQAVCSRNYKLADEYFKKLSEIPIEKHGYNTMISEVKYMLYDPFNKETSIKRYTNYLIEKYINREDGLYYEALLEYRLGNIDKSYDLLIKATGKYKRAPKSACFLAKEMLINGEYDAAIKYADLACVMSPTVDPAINIAEIIYIRNLARDCLLQQRMISGEEVSIEEVDELRLTYESILSLFDLIQYTRTIKERISYLNMIRLSLE